MVLNESVVIFIVNETNKQNNIIFLTVLSGVLIFIIQRLSYLFWIKPYREFKFNLSRLHDSMYIHQKEFDKLAVYIDDISIAERKEKDKIKQDLRENWSKLKSSYYQIEKSWLLIFSVKIGLVKSFKIRKEFNELEGDMNDLLNNCVLYGTNKKGVQNNNEKYDENKRGMLTQKIIKILKKYL